MRRIEVPEPVKVTHIGTGKPVYRDSEDGRFAEPSTLTLYEFIYAQLADPAFNATAMMVGKAIDCAKAVKRAEEAGEAPLLEEDHWATLKQVTERPTSGYTQFGHCAYPFMRAIIDAEKVEE